MEEIVKISERLVAAVEVVLNPFSPQNLREEAHKVLEEFKENSPNCSKCGFFLWKNPNPIIRHFALKLIDNHIKLRWNETTPLEKLSIKNGILEILSSGLRSVLEEENYLKDALSQIMVEMVKREWPQQWQDLLPELNALCCLGEIQRELVLLILLRLAEDIVQFQALPDQRRRDIHRTLCSDLKPLMEFFMRVLSEEYAKYSAANQRDPGSEVTRSHCRIVQVTLETLSAFVDWVPVVHITQNISLFYQLCVLLSDTELRLGAAKCLLQLVERKGKIEDRKPILVLFEENAMSTMFSALSPSDTLDEKHYLFLKQLCQVITTLGMQLSQMWGTVEDVEEPVTFHTYLNCLLAFTKHPSMVISQYAQLLWLTFFRHRHISETASIQQVLPDLLKIEMDKLMKIGFPSQNDSIVSDYSRLEFDADDLYGSHFYKYRGDVYEVVRLTSACRPELAFQLGSCCLTEHCSTKGQCDHVVLEMLSHYIDAVGSTISKRIQNDELPEIALEGVKLLQLTVNFQSEDPAVLSTSMSCMSSLLVFVSTSPKEILPAVLDKIFSVICHNQYGDANSLRYKELKNLRKHACSLLVKICLAHPKLLVEYFNVIYRNVKELISQDHFLNSIEKSTLVEALLLLSNEFCDYEKQLAFMQEVLSPIQGIWNSNTMKMGISNAKNFLTFMGLDQVTTDPARIESLLANRQKVRFCTDFMKACVKRCKWPEDSEVAKRGGFMHPSSDTNYRNPLAAPITPLLDGVFALTRTLHLLYEPSAQAQIRPCYAGVLDINDIDKSLILGFTFPESSGSSKGNTPMERMKLFLNMLYDSCLHIMGRSAEFIGLDFYACPGLVDAINSNLMCGIQHIPDFKFKSLIRSFLRPFALNAPTASFDDVVKVLSVFCPFMYRKLSASWANFKLRYGTSIGYEDQMTEMQEVLEDQLNRQLTREYISFLGSLLHKKFSNDQHEETMDEDNEQNCAPKNNTLSELGAKVLQDEVVRTAIVCTTFDALHWLDTVAALSSFRSCETILKQLTFNQLIREPSDANFLMASILRGLQELGEHEANLAALLALGTKIYDSLHPHFPCLNELFLHHVSCSPKDVQAFEEQFSRKNIKDRKKKDLFKNLVANIIGKHVGQHHRHNIEIQDLPPLPVPPRAALPMDEALKAGAELGLCQLFAAPPPSADWPLPDRLQSSLPNVAISSP